MLTRRNFLKAGTAAVSSGALLSGNVQAQSKKKGIVTSRYSGAALKAVSTVCGQCPSRCPAIGFVEDGKVVKLEGNPASIRTFGKLCARGHAGANQVYEPDRILYPMRRAGARGEGKWTRITWDQALDELAKRMKKLREQGAPEKLMLQHGLLSASARVLVAERFMGAYGSGTVVSYDCLGQSARRLALDLTWGGGEDNWDLDNTRFVLNFGSNFIEAHTNHVAMARRLASALVERRIRMVTFDVRLSNTAARSQEWVPIRPGADLAIVLAMCHVILAKDLHKGAGEDFLAYCRVTEKADATVAEKVSALKTHLETYTPAWAETLSGVPADRIERLARELATSRPACILSSRGTGSHHNGVETERAIQMLAAITGNINNPGGRCVAVTPAWNIPAPDTPLPVGKRLAVVDGLPGSVALPVRGVNHQVISAIKDGRGGRPDTLIFYKCNPAYSAPNLNETVAVLRDEKLIPFIVSVTPFYDETASLADLILPDATYLETWDFEDPVSSTQIAEYALRQPVVPPRGEARDFKDVCCDLAKRVGIPLGIKSAKDFVTAVVKNTPDIQGKARGFVNFAKKAVWHDPEAQPLHDSHARPVPPEALREAGVIFDAETGVHWNWKKAGLASEAEARRLGFLRAPNPSSSYVAQRFGGGVLAGFRPGAVPKSGRMELYSSALKAKGLSPLPGYMAVPGHEKMKPDQLVLTTFKVNVHTGSRTQNCKWLDEIYHDNPAWMNPVTASVRSIADGDRIVIAAALGQIEAVVRVTPAVVPGVVAISAHCGRTEYGRYASGKRAPGGADDPPHDKLKWWRNHGINPNLIIPSASDPISGQQCWMDTVVTVRKA
ncbi:MAG: molybdopterin-dependent oxidoreductase [Rhodocyclaceae bacterium]|nr:molybdopterin-dependent oxidoreductase [Rhodocyclaceae bacterium]